jgi:nucleotide-binding universal stress UspA family protein
MRALVWVTEASWQATVDHAAALLEADAVVTLLHVADDDPEALLAAAHEGLLGRPAHEVLPDLRAIAEAAAGALLDDAAARLGRPAAREQRHGRVEREVVAAARDADLLVLARDGDRHRLGPRSIGRAARFVVDHAPCTVVLVWPGDAPSLDTIPPHPR